VLWVFRKYRLRLTIQQYYFTYCEAGFVTKTLGDAIITVGREGALELMDGVPL
jgi:cyclopropane-fatty-acyl-phospholipid synthase